MWRRRGARRREQGWIRRSASQHSGSALALVATFLASRLRISGALMEILVGVAAAAVLGRLFGGGSHGCESPLAEVPGLHRGRDPHLPRRGRAGAGGHAAEMAGGSASWDSSASSGPFLGCAAIAYYLLGWSAPASWLAGIAMSTTSMAVVYAVMLETGLNRTDLREGDPGRLLRDRPRAPSSPWGAMFAPLHPGGRWSSRASRSWRSPCCPVRHAPPHEPLRQPDGGLPNQVGALHSLRPRLAGPVGPAARQSCPPMSPGWCWQTALGKDHAFIRRLRTLTIGFLTPIYFLRAGSFVSLPALLAAPRDVPRLLHRRKWGPRLSGSTPRSAASVPRSASAGTTRC